MAVHKGAARRPGPCAAPCAARPRPGLCSMISRATAPAPCPQEQPATGCRRSRRRRRRRRLHGGQAAVPRPPPPRHLEQQQQQQQHGAVTQPQPQPQPGAETQPRAAVSWVGVWAAFETGCICLLPWRLAASHALCSSFASRTPAVLFSDDAAVPCAVAARPPLPRAGAAARAAPRGAAAGLTPRPPSRRSCSRRRWQRCSSRSCSASCWRSRCWARAAACPP